jgi:hypothetical protein
MTASLNVHGHVYLPGQLTSGPTGHGGMFRDENGRNLSRTAPFHFLYFPVRFRICEIPFSYLPLPQTAGLPSA